MIHSIDSHCGLEMANGVVWLVFDSPAQRKESSEFFRRGGQLSQE
jgi:hypothetical protein